MGTATRAVVVKAIIGDIRSEFLRKKISVEKVFDVDANNDPNAALEIMRRHSETHASSDPKNTRRGSRESGTGVNPRILQPATVR